jgi:Zinc carboxypeptidase
MKKNLIRGTILALIASVSLNASLVIAQDLPSPEDFFGYQMGADRKLAHWDDLVRYYNQLGDASERMQVVNMGDTTLGNPFLALYISSPENLANLAQLKQYNAILTDPRGASQQEIDEAIEKGRVVFVQSMGLHSTEVAASQMAAELVYDMLVRDDADMRRILDNTVSILIPSFNPDGEIMVTEWYNETLGTEFEGATLPSLYHHYIGHDNNRDAYMQNTVESWYGAEIMFRQWVPQAYIDHHQMGPYSARLYVPPYSEPIRPGADPLVWREMSWYGAQIAYKEEEEDKAGVINAAMYSGWGHFGFHWITPFHNIAGMLTESASARLATPLFVHPDQLKGGRRGMPDYEPQTSHPNPWLGGWWHVRDIVEQQEIAALAALDLAARNRDTVLRNSYLKAMRQTERGANAATVAYIIPAEQHDPITRDHLISVLRGQGIEVMRSADGFNHEGHVYGPGTFVVSMAQPKQGVVRWLLGQTNYPDNSFTRARDGRPIRPYDMSTDNIAEYFGVRADPASLAVTADLAVITDAVIKTPGAVESGGQSLVFDGRQNAAFKAANLLMNAGITVSRIDQASGDLNVGDFVLAGNTSPALLGQIAEDTGVSFLSHNGEVDARALTRQRVALFQRYLGGNIDEGWTRLVLENFEFPYETIMDADLFEGDLSERFDVIILPDDGVEQMTGNYKDTDNNNFSGRRPDAFPPEYRSGFGDEGVASLDEFVKAGGTLLTFGEAGELAISEFKLPVRNVVQDISTEDFWSPGSTLRMIFDNTNPLSYGMPDTGVGLFLAGNDAYEIIPSEINHRIDRVATFAKRDIMASGWLVGEEYISQKASVVSVGHGEGRVILIGFRPQFRSQTHGTFKLVFNALMSLPESEQR